jgi:hypothetical protein
MFDDEYDSLNRAGRNLEERRIGADVLCGGCKSGHVFRRRGKLDVTVRCGMWEGREVPPDIAECSDYEPRTQMSLFDMQEIALKVDGRVGINDGSYR